MNYSGTHTSGIHQRLVAPFFFAALLSLTSCAVVSKLDEAFLLKDFSDEKETQSRYIERQDQGFQELVPLAKANDPFHKFSRKASFIEHFGEPIRSEMAVSADGAREERLLYRRATDYTSGEKIYVFFDESGHLLRVQYASLKP